MDKAKRVQSGNGSDGLGHVETSIALDQSHCFQKEHDQVQ